MKTALASSAAAAALDAAARWIRQPTAAASRQCREGRRRHAHDLRAATQANSLIALPQIDLGQIVLVHQLDELAHLAYVEHVAGARTPHWKTCLTPDRLSRPELVLDSCSTSHRRDVNSYESE